MRGSGRAQHFRSGLSGEVAIVEARPVVRKDNFWPELSGEAGAGRVFAGALGAEELVGDPNLCNVQNDRVSSLRVVKNEICGRAGGVAFIVEVVAVDVRNRARREK